MFRYLATFALVGAALAFFLDPAFAQTTTTTTVDFTPLFTQLVDNYLLPVIIVVVLLVAGLALNRWGNWVPQSVRDSILAELDALLEQGKGLVAAKIVNMKEFTLHIDNPVIATAAGQLIGEVQPLLTKLGVTPASVQDYIAKKIIGKLGNDSMTEPDHPTPAGAIPGTNVTPDGAVLPMTSPAPAV